MKDIEMEKNDLMDIIEDILKRQYEIEDGDRYSMESGAYLNGEWLSIQNILDAINDNIDDYL